MKIISTVLISVIVFLALNGLIPTKEECEIYNSTVRLHVIANSDSEADQAVKLKVRDKILDRVSEIEAKSKNDALEKITEIKDELCQASRDVLMSEGICDDVSIEIGKEEYPTRYYEDFALPAGEYTSVRVIIGEGNGQNWWCVLYPPLCTASAIDYGEDGYIHVGLTKDQYNLITGAGGEYKIKFKLLEIAKEAFGMTGD